MKIQLLVILLIKLFEGRKLDLCKRTGLLQYFLYLERVVFQWEQAHVPRF